MNDKFTIRDFFVYFFSGCAFCITLFLVEFKSINELLLLNKENLKDYSTVVLFASLPALYFIGQIIQSIDTPLYIVGSYIWKLYNKKQSKWWKLLYLIVCSHRVSGKLNLRNIKTSEFWLKCNELTMVSKYSHSEYWYIMNDLFKGITLITTFFSILCLVQQKYLLTLLFMLLTFIFWVRARYFATIFIDTVISSRQALENIKPENIK